MLCRLGLHKRCPQSCWTFNRTKCHACGRRMGKIAAKLAGMRQPPSTTEAGRGEAGVKRNG